MKFLSSTQKQFSCLEYPVKTALILSCEGVPECPLIRPQYSKTRINYRLCPEKGDPRNPYQFDTLRPSSLPTTIITVR